MVIVKTVLVWNLFSSYRSRSLKSYIAVLLSEPLFDGDLIEGTIMLGTVCFRE